MKRGLDVIGIGSLNWSYADAYDCQAKADFELSNYAKAIISLTKYLQIERNPKWRSDAYERRGDCYLKTGEYRKAISDITQAIKIGSQKRDKANLKAYLRTDIEKIMLYEKRAEAFNAVKDYDQAIKDYDTVIRLAKDDPLSTASAYLKRGDIFIQLGKIEQALHDYDKVIKLNPAFSLAALAYFRRGLAYSKLGNQKKALEDVKLAACVMIDSSTGFQAEAWDFLKSKGLWSGIPEEKIELCHKVFEEYQEKKK